MSRRAQQWVAREPGGLDVLELIDVDVAEPPRGEVTIDVRACGVNPADAKHVARGGFTGPRPVGYEISGVLSAVGPDTSIASGGGAVGEEVIAFRVLGGYASSLTVAAADVFSKPAALDDPTAANLLLAGTTAAEMLHVTGVRAGDTILVHGASGAVGVSVLQQARLMGVRVVGTASEARFDVVRRYGGVPVVYGDGVEQRLQEEALEGFAAALDTVGTDEAVDVSLALLSDRARVVTIAAAQRAKQEGFRAIAGSKPDSAHFRDAARARLIDLAARGDLEVPMARTYPLAAAREALSFLMEGHPGGKVALIP